MRDPLARVAKWIGSACVCAAAWSLVPGVAAAQEPTEDTLKTKFAIDDENPEGSVPTHEEAMRAPLQMGYWTMLVSDRAEAALARGEHQSALKYYRALAKAVPDRAVSFAKVCALYETLGDWANAVDACKTALAREGANVDNYTRYVRLVLAKRGPLTPAELGDVDAAIAHLSSELQKAPEGPEGAAAALEAGAAHALLLDQLRCEVGARLESRERLETCAKALNAAAPNDPRTIAFALALALIARDFDAADALVGRATRAGIPEAAIEQMRSRVRSEREHAGAQTSVLGDARVLGAIAALLLVVAALLTFRQKRLRTAA